MTGTNSTQEANLVTKSALALTFAIGVGVVGAKTAQDEDFQNVTRHTSATGVITTINSPYSITLDEGERSTRIDLNAPFAVVSSNTKRQDAIKTGCIIANNFLNKYKIQPAMMNGKVFKRTREIMVGFKGNNCG